MINEVNTMTTKLFAYVVKKEMTGSLLFRSLKKISKVEKCKVLCNLCLFGKQKIYHFHFCHQRPKRCICHLLKRKIYMGNTLVRFFCLRGLQFSKAPFLESLVSTSIESTPSSCSRRVGGWSLSSRKK